MYEILTVPDSAYDASEQLGTKFKFWFQDSDGKQKLFKQGRENTGENWSEKISCELANLIGLPHVNYDFARWRDKSGVVSSNFVSSTERLVLGNEILSPNTKRVQYSTKHQTIRKVTLSLKLALVKVPYRFLEIEIGNANDVFIGYLMLDALIGNTDRHDENWGLILSHRGIELAPTYDHASSLGRELSDQVRQRRLGTPDPNFTVGAYSLKARSAMYDSSDDAHSLTPLDAFLKAGETSLAAKRFWLTKLSRITPDSINNILTEIPYDIMSEEARVFATRMILFNQSRLQTGS